MWKCTGRCMWWPENRGAQGGRGEVTPGRNGTLSEGPGAGDTGLKELMRDTKRRDPKGKARRTLANVRVQGMSDRRIYKRPEKEVPESRREARNAWPLALGGWEDNTAKAEQEGKRVWERRQRFPIGATDCEMGDSGVWVCWEPHQQNWAKALKRGQRGGPTQADRSGQVAGGKHHTPGSAHGAPPSAAVGEGAMGSRSAGLPTG